MQISKEIFAALQIGGALNPVQYPFSIQGQHANICKRKDFRKQFRVTIFNKMPLYIIGFRVSDEQKKYEIKKQVLYGYQWQLRKGRNWYF